MSDIPYLTIEDKKNAYYLDDDSAAALIVEGKTDFFIYGKLLMYSNLDWQQIDIVVGECKNEILKYHSNGIPFKYIALLDSDYDVCKNSCIQDQKLIYTHFYNMENYLVSEGVLIQTATDYRTIRDGILDSTELIKTIEDSLLPYLLIVVGKLENGWTFPFEKFNIDRWEYAKENKISYGAIENYVISELKKEGIEINQMDWVYLTKILESYLQDHTVDNLLNGKRKLEATFHHFKKIYAQQMHKKNIINFTQDLCKNIMYSLAARELVNSIDERFKKLWDCPEKEMVNSAS